MESIPLDGPGESEAVEAAAAFSRATCSSRRPSTSWSPRPAARSFGATRGWPPGWGSRRRARPGSRSPDGSWIRMLPACAPSSIAVLPPCPSGSSSTSSTAPSRSPTPSPAPSRWVRAASCSPGNRWCGTSGRCGMRWCVSTMSFRLRCVRRSDRAGPSRQRRRSSSATTGTSRDPGGPPHLHVLWQGQDRRGPLGGRGRLPEAKLALPEPRTLPGLRGEVRGRFLRTSWR